MIVTEEELLGSLEKLLLGVVGKSGESAAKRLEKLLPSRALRALQVDFAFDITNPLATEWAREHAAELIEGISETTRGYIRELIEAAFEEQIDVRELADTLAEALGDAARAETIARTETITASNQGQILAWEQAKEEGLLGGNEKKVWIVTPDDRLCPICEPLDGVTVGFSETFDVEGEALEGPPAHPNCRCAVGLTT